MAVRQYIIKIFIIFLFILNNYSFSKIMSSSVTLQSTFHLSSLVIAGNVKNITAFGQNKIAVISITDVIKGFLPANQQDIKVFFMPLIEHPKTFTDIEKRMLNFSKNENVILFLNPYQDYFVVNNFYYGKLTIINGEINIPYLYQNNNLLAKESFDSIKNKLKSWK
ncbi:hypothetical protein THERMOT_1882 [Bathymodiolus thermophilus thioautotrophic gill symbiont]|uniref:hypothetical protein n=1 Tax=Bathymodiolus thermophilus thioautotrophic gill symbiont TaxID=2360 RepID=UPI00192CAFD8|nr:hypothetical protein [Bathymodiolus thermophilus thioautotrophic gill symbiont]CAB5503954.1 hypothetical protein THERMOT_1882 [Bathymodiolus thermophilus thioautotrophic gill symbiont]